MHGWGKLYKKIGERDFFKNTSAIILYNYIIIFASIKARVVNFGRHEVSLQAGQIVLSIRTMAQQLGVSQKVVRGALQKLCDNNLLSLEPGRQYTIATLQNPDEAQALEAGAHQTGAQQRGTAKQDAAKKGTPDKGTPNKGTPSESNEGTPDNQRKGTPEIPANAEMVRVSDNQEIPEGTPKGTPKTQEEGTVNMSSKQGMTRICGQFEQAVDTQGTPEKGTPQGTPEACIYLDKKKEEEAKSNDFATYAQRPSAPCAGAGEGTGLLPMDMPVTAKAITDRREQKVIDVPVAYTSFVIPLANGSDWPVSQRDYDLWKQCYPGVNLDQELLRMRAWADANPTRCKTERGIKRFVNSWLTKAQDRARPNETQGQYGNGNGYGYGYSSGSGQQGLPATPTEYQYQMQQRRLMAQAYLNSMQKAEGKENDAFDAFISSIPVSDVNDILNDR